MSRRLCVDVFVEDVAHERLLLPLLARSASDEGRSVTARIVSARGGHAAAIDEMEKVQRVIATGTTGMQLPDLFVVGIDGNCTTANAKRKEIRNRSRPEFADRLVIACPDPHIERWYMADPDSFHHVVGSRPDVGKEKCQRDYYVHLLAATVRAAGHPSTLGGLEWASDLVVAMDLYRAAKHDPALGTFLDELKGALRAAP